MGFTKNILYIFIFFAVTSTQSVLAQGLSASQLLQRDIMVSSRTLTNDVFIYNYFNIQKVWPELETSQGRINYIQRYLSQRAGDFWELSFSEHEPSRWAAGPGLYFAIDPLISQRFGNVFIEIRIPAGTRFINVVNPLPLKKDTIQALQQEGYINASDMPELFPKQNGFYRDTLRLMVQQKYLNFRQLVQQILSQNQIQFVEYNFNTSLMGFCKTHSYSAFNYIGSLNAQDPKNAFITAEYKNVQMYSTELNFPNQSPSEIEGLARITKFRNVLQQVNSLLQRGQKNASIQAYILSQYTADEYTVLKQSAFSCK